MILSESLLYARQRQARKKPLAVGETCCPWKKITMKFTTATSTLEDTLSAGREVLGRVCADLDGSPDLAFLFITPQHAPQFEEVATMIDGELDASHLVGCTAEGVIGGGCEYERTPALTLWAAQLPGAKISSTHVRFEETADGYVFLGLPPLDTASGSPTSLLLLGEPLSFPTELLLAHMAEDNPGIPVIGGMASGARSPGENRLFWGSQLLVDGAIAVAVSGDVRVRPAVSQGCRPFGKSFIVTRSDGQLILELGGRPILEQLSEQLDLLSPYERTLARNLLIGVAIDATKRTHQHGDFLVRNVLGINQERGGLAITDSVRPGTTVQFHLRDAEAASEDLDLVLQRAIDDGSAPGGALIFSCNGRGQRLFSTPHHDAVHFQRTFSSLPLAGFFAAGELGPVEGQNFLHGYTASIALFESSRPTS